MSTSFQEWHVQERNSANNLAFKFALIFIFTSFWQRTIGEEGVGLLGRLVPADFFLAAVILLSVIANIEVRCRALAEILLALVGVMLVGAMLSLDVGRSIVEVLVHAFLMVGFVALVTLIDTEDRFYKAAFAFLASGVVASVVGVWDSLATSVGFKSLLEAPEGYTALGAATFRNYGQAGNYVIHVAVLALALIIGLGRGGDSRSYLKMVTWPALLLSLLLLAISSKVSSVLGLAAALSLMVACSVLIFGSFAAISKISLLLILTVPVLIGLITYGGEDLAGRITGRFMARISAEAGGGGFATDNWTAAILAFGDYPFFGTGIGAFAGNYHEFAVHSTYLKLLAEAGIFALLIFIFFLIVVLSYLKFDRILMNDGFTRVGVLLGYSIIGLSLSWGYTYNLRKREFWIILALFIAARTISRLVVRAHRHNS